MRLGLM